MAIQIVAEAPDTRILLFPVRLRPRIFWSPSASGHDLDLVAKPVHPIAIHWSDSAVMHDVRSCQWCRERWVDSGGAYPHGERLDCACAWCRALAAGSG